MVSLPPRRVFLDTCVVNFIMDYGEQIHEAIEPPEGLNAREVADIDALYNIWRTGELAISPLTYREIASTANPSRAYELENWFAELWNYWRAMVKGGHNLPTFVEAEETRVDILSTGILDVLPDVSDRTLICDAIVYRCDLFCTRDYRTILKHRSVVEQLPIRIVTPIEWWRELEKWFIASSR
jgi:hypothetical protein